MNDILVIRGLPASAWTGIVRVASETSFADWIAARWTLPEPARRATPPRNFRSPRREGLWLALSARVFRPSWQVTLALNPSANWTNSIQYKGHRRNSSHFLTAAYRPTNPALWTSRLQTASLAWSFFPVTHIWNQMKFGKESAPGSISPNRLTMRLEDLGPSGRSRSLAPWMVPLLSTLAQIRSLRSHSPAPAAAQQLGQRIDADGKSGRVVREPTLAPAALVFHGTFQTTFATANPASLSGNLTNSTGFHLAMREFCGRVQLRLPVPPSTVKAPAPARDPGMSQLVLQMRNATEGAYSRPGMQFAQAAAPVNQSDLLAGMRNVEQALANFQASPPVAPPVPDMLQLTTHVYAQLERQLRIERERRGR